VPSASLCSILDTLCVFKEQICSTRVVPIEQTGCDLKDIP